MAITNQDRVGKGLDLLRLGLGPFVERELNLAVKAGSLTHQAIGYLTDDPKLKSRPIDEWDSQALLKVMWDMWNDVFARILGPTERSLVQEVRTWRNKWAHQEPLSSDDTDRALDSMSRLLTAVSAPEAEELGKMKLELRRLIYEEQVRGEKRKTGSSLIEGLATGNLKSWRDIVQPHPDVASGKYQEAEFAADLWQVYLGQGSDEYRTPREFFRRTYLTESLKHLLVGAAKRLSASGGDPVIQLQTNFGGGKTHSMLALFHMFSGAKPGDLPGMDTVLAEAGITKLPAARRVVLVGNKISPGNPSTKADGTVVRTLWGELAWQLGGKPAYDRVALDDERATNPGDVLRELFVEHGPCLILIDEWVAYARQLHDGNDLPAGSFETMFSFAQALTESAKLAGNCLLVISLPASDTGTSPHAQADDAEVGGIRGREALERLRNVVGRLEASWRPATAEEGFEIVRRRLFDSIPGDHFKHRDVTARAFAELYRSQKSEFPPECAESDYEKRIQAAFPVHPEIFDRLYSDWSTLVKFQRTRGVLRLMASVIHCLWREGDRNPLIMPSTLPLDDRQVQSELTRYLSDNWAPIIEKDVAGRNSLPSKIDGEQINLGKLHATQRVARTVFLGSAPMAKAAHHGLEDRRVKLGCVMPGESVAIFGDALRRLSAAATYLYQDGPLVWYGTQPTVTKLAEDRAEQLRRDPDKAILHLEERLRQDLRNPGDFHRVHPLARSGSDVADDYHAKLVVLPPEASHNKEASKALELAKAILESRGNIPRLFQNTLVFLAADRVRMQDLDEALRRYLAWTSILDDKETLNLDPHQARQAETQRKSADAAVAARIPETYRWLLVPEQTTPTEPLKWEVLSLGGGDPLAVLASKKLRSSELLLSSYGSTMLRIVMDRIPLWRGDHVPISLLMDDFSRFLYLPRLSGPDVLARTIENGLSLTSWSQESFAYAEGFDEVAGRYRGLQTGRLVHILPDSQGLLVRPDVAQKQIDKETAGPKGPEVPLPPVGPDGPPPKDPDDGTVDPPIVPQPGPKRYHGTVELDSLRVGRDAGRIAEEVIAHMTGIVGAKVRITLEIEAEIPAGASDHVVRTVTENSRTLKFKGFGFEKE